MLPIAAAKKQADFLSYGVRYQLLLLVSLEFEATAATAKV